MYIDEAIPIAERLVRNEVIRSVKGNAHLSQQEIDAIDALIDFANGDE